MPGGIDDSMVHTIWQLDARIARCWRHAVVRTVVCLLLAGTAAWFNGWPGYYVWTAVFLLLAWSGCAAYRDEVALLRADYTATLAERRRQWGPTRPEVRPCRKAEGRRH